MTKSLSWDSLTDCSEFIIKCTLLGIPKPPVYTENQEENLKAAKKYLDNYIEKISILAHYPKKLVDQMKFEVEHPLPEIKKVEAYKVTQNGKSKIIFI